MEVVDHRFRIKFVGYLGLAIKNVDNIDYAEILETENNIDCDIET